MHRQTFDPEKFQLTIARYKKFGESVEIVIDADQAFAFRSGTDLDLKDIIKSEDIFKDAQKGELASPQVLEKLFSDKSGDDLLWYIIREGEIHFTAEFLRQRREDKRKQVLHHIHENAIDPKTKLPIPMTRIEGAMQQVSYNFDPFIPTDAQAADVLNLFKPLMPISMSTKTIQLLVPASVAGKVQGIARQHGTVKKESWQNDGTLLLVCEVTAGGYERLFRAVESASHGGVSIQDI